MACPRNRNVRKIIVILPALAFLGFLSQYWQFRRVHSFLFPLFDDVRSGEDEASSQRRGNSPPAAVLLPSEWPDLHSEKTIERNETKETVLDERPIIAICSCTLSLKRWTKSTSTSLETLMIPSIEKTVTDEEQKAFRFQLHLGIDEGDKYWTKYASRIQTADWIELVVHYYPKSNKIPFNPLMRDAYQAGAEYMVRINDDTEFQSVGWIFPAVRALRGMEPPNVGTVGPWDPRNTRMFTHDMVHRTHLDIFNQVYYPEAFSNWWIDDWITAVYRPYRSKWVKSWSVKHHNVHGTRYSVDHSQKKQLKSEIDKGRQQIKSWLVANGYNATEKPFRETLLSTELYYKSLDKVPKMFLAERR